MKLGPLVEVSRELEVAGLIWQPEVGDEISQRRNLSSVSILVDPQGMSPTELRTTYLWLPTVEQMVMQLEARQTILFHAGLEFSNSSMCYKTVLRSPLGPIESEAETLRLAVGQALRELLMTDRRGPLH